MVEVTKVVSEHAPDYRELYLDEFHRHGKKKIYLIALTVLCLVLFVYAGGLAVELDHPGYWKSWGLW